MHELSLAEHILHSMNDYIKKNNVKISKIHIHIGELSTIVSESLVFSFDIVKINTLLEKAELEIHFEKGIAKCKKCLKEQEISKYATPCSFCGHAYLDILSGNQMLIQSIELEKKV